MHTYGTGTRFLAIHGTLDVIIAHHPSRGNGNGVDDMVEETSTAGNRR